MKTLLNKTIAMIQIATAVALSVNVKAQTSDTINTGNDNAVYASATADNGTSVSSSLGSATDLPANYMENNHDTNNVTSIVPIVVYTQVSVFPNPCNGCFNLNLGNTTNKDHICVYNNLGNTVYEGNLTVGTNRIDLKCCKNGMYIYTVLTCQGVLVSNGKIMVQ